MNKTQFQWWGHTTLSLQTASGMVLLQPFFTNKNWCLKRYDSASTSAAQLTATRAVFFANANVDRFDKDVCKYFKQQSTAVYLPNNLKIFFDKFFHFQSVALQDGVAIPIDNITITPIATPAKIFRFWKWHNEIFHFLIDVEGERTLILSDGLEDGAIWDHLLKLGKIDRLIFPISKLPCLPFAKKKVVNWQQLVKMVEFLNIDSITPYAYGSYATSPEGLAAPKLEFENQMSVLGLASRVSYLTVF